MGVVTRCIRAIAQAMVVTTVVKKLKTFEIRLQVLCMIQVEDGRDGCSLQLAMMGVVSGRMSIPTAAELLEEGVGPVTFL